MKILAIIPARGGSKRIPFKNMYFVKDRPLIKYTIDAALGSKLINKTVVSTDNESISLYCKQFCDVLQRPNDISLDNSTSEDAISHALKSFPKYDAFILLQPTSPLRTDKHIDDALNMFCTCKCTSVISVYADNIHLTLNETLSPTYVTNGAIYITYTDGFLNNQKLLTNNCLPYVMNKKDSLDIDTIEDMRIFANTR